MGSQLTITIAAAALMRADGKTLLVRKRGATAFMQPGGKIEPGEAPRAALAREILEELGLVVDPVGMEPLGSFSAPAANEAGAVVRAEMFRVLTAGTPCPAAEIAEAIWVDPAASAEELGVELAPLTRDCVLPAIRE